MENEIQLFSRFFRQSAEVSLKIASAKQSNIIIELSFLPLFDELNILQTTLEDGIVQRKT